MTDPAGGEPVRAEPVRYEVVRGVAWLTIDRPEARNALSKAARAYEIGLVNQVVPDAGLVPAAQALAGKIAANAPLSVMAAKRTVYLSLRHRLDDAFGGAERIWEPVYRSVAHLGIRSLPYSYAVNGLPRPDAPIRVELAAPDGGEWTWGPEGAANRVSGTALDFCLVVTQRRHRSDTGLVITGDSAAQWIGIAQAFAGAAGWGRKPLSAGGATTGAGPSAAGGAPVGRSPAVSPAPRRGDPA